MTRRLTLLAGGGVPRCDTSASGHVDRDTAVDVVVTVRSRALNRGMGWVNRQAWWAPARRVRLSRAQCLDIYGAGDADLSTVRTSLSSWGLECSLEDSSDRLVHASGSVALMERAFGVSLDAHDGHHGRSDPIALPPRLVGVVRAVTGLDACTTLRPYLEASSRRAPVSRDRIEERWGLAAHLRGAGTCVSVTAPVEIDAADLRAAGLPGDVGVFRASPGKTAPVGWPQAIVAQVHAIRVAAPEARVVVHAGRGGESGALETLSAAIHDSVRVPQVIVAGWGAPEALWSPQAMLAVEQRFLAAAAMGVTVVCAAPAGEPVFPASAPHALACAALPPGSRAASVATSGVFAAPVWRGGSPGDGRRTPDVLAPSVLRFEGGTVAGAAIAASVCAGAVAAFAASAGAPLGYTQPLLFDGGAPAGPREPDLAALLRRFETAVPPAVAPISADHRAHPPAIRVRRHG